MTISELSLSAELKNMKRAITLKPPKTFAKSRDADNPPWTEAMLGPAKVRRGKAAPKAAAAKSSVAVLVDEDVVAFFRSKGKNYQVRINTALRSVMRDTPKARTR
jgi:uncharacterized protein (DUF4415 family)